MEVRLHGSWRRPAALAAGTLLAFPACGALVVNELDYDQVGSDTGEFVELFNASTASISLDGYQLALINGADGSAYREFALVGEIAPGGFFVLCGDGTVVPNCDQQVSPSSNLIQNGAPEALALYAHGVLIDSLSYEGVLSGFTEGTALAIEDDNSTPYLTLARVINGVDSDDNGADFMLGCATPGYGNVAFTGSCAAPTQVTPVPEPSAAWLMGMGLAGMLQLYRRARRAHPPA